MRKIAISVSANASNVAS